MIILSEVLVPVFGTINATAVHRKTKFGKYFTITARHFLNARLFQHLIENQNATGAQLWKKRRNTIYIFHVWALFVAIKSGRKRCSVEVDSVRREKIDPIFFIQDKNELNFYLYEKKMASSLRENLSPNQMKQKKKQFSKGFVSNFHAKEEMLTKSQLPFYDLEIFRHNGNMQLYIGNAGNFFKMSHPKSVI